MRVAEAFANRAAVALELSERIGREGTRALLEGQELERKRLARELHDETGQALASILMGLTTLEAELGEEPLALIRGLVGSALDNVRNLTVELRPPVLDDYGLGAALERLATMVAAKSGIEVDLAVAEPVVRLSPEHETALYRIVQEALTNIVKHAGASTVSIMVTSGEGGVVRALVEDDGVGFDPEAVRDGALGLVGMRERVHLCQGRIELQSSPGTGTTLLVELPV
jgi:signal transduction histidine kinase